MVEMLPGVVTNSSLQLPGVVSESPFSFNSHDSLTFHHHIDTYNVRQ